MKVYIRGPQPAIAITLLFGLASCSGCRQPAQTLRNSAPVVLTLYWKEDRPAAHKFDMSMSGELMTTSEVGADAKSSFRPISGKIGDKFGKGWALYKKDKKGRSQNQPVFRAIVAPPENDGHPVALIKGESKTEWVLLVEGVTAAKIYSASRRALRSPAVFSPGDFSLQVDFSSGR